MNLEKIALSRRSEALSEGENFKKILLQHISPYVNQVEKAKLILDLKNIDKSSDVFLEWFGVLKGIRRPKTTVNNAVLNQFFNAFTPDKVGFSDKDISKPLFFGQLNYFKVGDLEFKRIIRAYCKLTGFRGTVDEYSLFFQEIFGIDIQIRMDWYDLAFIVENTNTLTIDDVLIFDLTPTLSQTNNLFFKSPYSLFSLAFDNISGTSLDFGVEQNSSLYFPF